MRARAVRDSRARLFGATLALLVCGLGVPASGARDAPTVPSPAPRVPESGGRTEAPAKIAAPRFPQAGVILRQRLSVRARPSPRARVVKMLPQFRSDFRPTVVFAVGGTRTASGLWYRVSVPMRPNGRYGWVRASAVGLHPVRARIVVDRSARTLILYRDAKVRYRTRTAVCAPGMETPVGRFYVTAAFKAREPFLGAYAFETSAYSKLSEWPGGGVVGIHGTPRPELLGRAVSHGCIRISNRAALTLKRLVPVGTPVRIVP